MIPRLKRHLRVSELSELRPGEFSLALGFSPETGYQLHVEKPALELLALIGSGPKSVEDLWEQFHLAHPDIARRDFDGAITQLMSRGVVEDAEPTSVPEEFQRYDRHVLFYSLFSGNGLAPQMQLQSRCVTLIGMGGIGSWVSYLLAAAGVGTLILVDGDVVEQSNLTRQVLYSESDVGTRKVDAAASRLRSMNAHVKIETIPSFVDSASSASEAIDGADFVVLSGDNDPRIHYWVESACQNKAIPYSAAGYRDFYGVVGPIVVPDETLPLDIRDGENPIERNFERLAQQISSGFQPPSFGPLNGIVASIASAEAIKFLSRVMPPITLHRQLTIDFRTWDITFRSFLKSTTDEDRAGDQHA